MLRLSSPTAKAAGLAVMAVLLCLCFWAYPLSSPTSRANAAHGHRRAAEPHKPPFVCTRSEGGTGTQEHRSARCEEGTLWRWLTQVDIEEILIAMERRLGIKDGDKVFEAGSGCGSGLAFLQRRHRHRGPRGIHISGIDISRGALAYAQRKYTKDALFCYGNIKEPFSFIPTDSFDVSFSYGVLGYTNAPESCATLRELVRVTKPGGGIFFNTQEPDCPSYSWGQGKQRRLWRRCLRGVDVKIEVVPEFELRRGQSVNRPLAYCPHHTTAVFIRKSRPLAVPPGYRSAPRGRGGSGGVGGIDGGSSVGEGGSPTADGASNAAHQLRTSRPSLSGNDWHEYIDKSTGATYYHNSRTQKTQWDFPYADAAMASKRDGVDVASNAATTASATAGGVSPMLRSAMVFLPGVVDNAFFRALARLALNVATSGRTTATLAAPVIVVDGGQNGFSFVDVLELSPSLRIPSSPSSTTSSSSSSTVWGVSEVTSVHEEHPEHLRYEVNFTLIDGSTVMALFEHVQEGRCRPAALNGITNHTLVVAGGYTREDRVFQRGISVVDRRDHLSILLFNQLPPMPPVSSPSSASSSSSSFSKRQETPPKVPESERNFRMHESEWTRANDDVRRYPMKDRVEPLKDIELILHTPDGRSTELAPYLESILVDELGLWALATNWPEYQTSDVNRLRWPMWAPGEYTVEMVDSRSKVPLQANAATESADIIVGDWGGVPEVVNNQGPVEGSTQQFMPSREPLCTTRFTVVENSMEANSEEAMLEAVKRYWRLTYVHYSPNQQPGHV